jgi:hypothetical protein
MELLQNKKNGIYAVDEIYGVKVSNREFAQKAKAKGYQSDRIASDSNKIQIIQPFLAILHRVGAFFNPKYVAHSVFIVQFCYGFRFVSLPKRRKQKVISLIVLHRIQQNLNP